MSRTKPSRDRLEFLKYLDILHNTRDSNTHTLSPFAFMSSLIRVEAREIPFSRDLAFPNSAHPLGC